MVGFYFHRYSFCSVSVFVYVELENMEVGRIWLELGEGNKEYDQNIFVKKNSNEKKKVDNGEDTNRAK